MINYILKRLMIIIPTFIGITISVYMLASLAPGTPLESLLRDPYITPEQYELKKIEYGLDQPVYIQYLRWVGQLIRGNFGISFSTNRSVAIMINERLGPTLILTLSSVLIGLLISIPLGVMAAYKPYSGWDYIATGYSFLGSSIPSFLIGLVTIFIFAALLGWFPMGGMYDVTGDRSTRNLIFHLILPSTALSFQLTGSLISQVRGAMLEVLQEDFILTARAKGINEKAVIVRHALRNSLIPVVTVVSTMLPLIIGGAVITEQIFSWPGIGTLMVQAILARDYPVIMGLTVYIALFILIGNTLADILYALLDPRIRH